MLLNITIIIIISDIKNIVDENSKCCTTSSMSRINWKVTNNHKLLLLLASPCDVTFFWTEIFITLTKSAVDIDCTSSIWTARMFMHVNINKNIFCISLPNLTKKCPVQLIYTRVPISYEICSFRIFLMENIYFLAQNALTIFV